MKKKLKLLLNIGSDDAKRLGLDKTLSGETVEVTDEAANEMVTRGWAEGDKPAGAKADADKGEDAEEEEADVSPLSNSNVSEAVDQISRMRSKERLQEIIDTDPRTSVKDAARKRLAAI